MLLAGDVGGTKTQLALLDGDHNPIAHARYASAEYASFDALLASFLNEHKAAVTNAFVAVAGPVVAGRVQPTNLDWPAIEAQSLKQSLGAKRVDLLNDAQAMALAIPYLNANEITTIKTGSSQPHGPIALVALGTGLGQASLSWRSGRYVAHPSEGGHSDFAPVNAQQDALLAFMRLRYDHVSVERVCSGQAIPDLFKFVKQQQNAGESDELQQQLKAAPDSTPIIIQAALADKGRCELCAAALALFTEILGAVCGNVALSAMATGGVYLGGGIPQKILPLLQSDRFASALVNKGRMSNVLERIPAHTILTPHATLLGALIHAIASAERLKAD